MILMIILAMFGGVLTTLSMVISSSLGKKIGVVQSTLIHYIGAVIASVILIFILGNNMSVTPSDFTKMPFYIFLGGVIGIGIVYSSNIVVPKIPVVYSTLLMFVGQITAGIVIDAIVLRDFSFMKLLGAAIVGVGILYNSRIDAKEGNA